MPKNKRKSQRKTYIVEEEDGVVVLEEFITSPSGILFVVFIAILFTILTNPKLYTYLLSIVTSSVHMILSIIISMFKTKVVSTVDNNDNHMESPNDVITERFKAFNKAIELSGQKDYKNALPWFETTNVTIDGKLPTNDVLNTEWGNAYYFIYKDSIMSSNNNNAMDDKNNNDIDDNNINSSSKNDKKSLQKAIQHYKKAVEINENSFSAIGNLAEIYMRYYTYKNNESGTSTESDGKKNIDEMTVVKELLDKLIEIRNICEPHRQVGKKNKLEPPSFCKDIKENKEEFSETIRKSFIMKAELFFNEEKFIEAEAFLKQAAKIRQSLDVYEKFGLVYEKLNKFKLAYTYYSKCKANIKFCKERCSFLDKVGKKAANEKSKSLISDNETYEKDDNNVKKDNKSKRKKKKRKKKKKKKKKN